MKHRFSRMLPLPLSYKKKWAAYSIISLMAAALLAQIPVGQWKIINRGIDNFNYHLPLSQGQTITQHIHSDNPVIGIGLILVNLRHAASIAPVTVTIRDTVSGLVLAEQTMSGSLIQDDEFSRFTFATPLAHTKELSVEITSPQASKANPVGVRFNPKPAPNMAWQMVNGQPREGNLALEIGQKVPVRVFIGNMVARQQEKLPPILAALAAALLVALLALKGGWQHIPNKYHRPLEYLCLAIVVITAIISRIAILPYLGGVSCGDAYNYLNIGNSILHGENPLVGEKRLPGFPLLLIPALLNPLNDHITAMRILSILSAGACLIMLSFLARSIGLPWAVQLVAPTLIAWQKDFFWISLRPEPYTFYAFLLLCALALFYNARKPWQQILYGAVLGYSAMTRQEGFMLAFILGICSVLYWKRFMPAGQAPVFISKQTILTFMRLYIPALLIISPFLVSNTISFGNPFFTPYFESNRLQTVDSWLAFTDNLAGTWGVIGSLGKPVLDELERYSLSNPIMAATAAMIMLIFLSALNNQAGKFHRLPYVYITLGILLILAVWGLALGTTLFVAVMPVVIAAAILISPLGLIVAIGTSSLPILATVLGQLGVATWFHPFTKHFQQVLPLISLGLGTTILMPVIASRIGDKRKHGLQRTGLVLITSALLFPVAIIEAKTLQAVPIAIDDSNASGAFDSVTYRAVKRALQYPGPHGFDQGYNQARLYVGDAGKYFTDESTTLETQAAWLAQNNVRVLVITNDKKIFTPQPSWQLIGYYKSEGKNERLYESFVYLIP